MNIDNCFAFFDKNGDGSISLLELKKMFKKENKFTDEEWSQFMKDADKNGDG